MARPARLVAVEAPVRWPLLAVGVAFLVVLAIDTAAALQSSHLPFDVPVERAIQSFPFGPAVAVFWAFDWLEGIRELVASALVIAVITLARRRDFMLALVAASSAIVYHVLEATVARPRPSNSLVHVLRHTHGSSYPSGHIDFLSWVCVLLVVCLGFGRLRRPALTAVSVLAVCVLLLGCLGRIYIGEHWPSDVVGGIALGLGWTFTALSFRRLSDPAQPEGRPLTAVTRADRALILSSKAGSITPAAERKLRRAFADSLILEFEPSLDLDHLITAEAPVVVAGGDGTIGSVVRGLADTKHPIGLIPLGTYNNFARALKVPRSIDRAIELATTGHARPITLGMVNDRVFLEAAAIGLFGSTIAAGDSAKERRYGDLAREMRQVVDAKPFSYELAGDLHGRGRCMSLVFTNTPTIGTQLPVSDGSPRDPHLLLSIHAGSSRLDIVRRAIAGTVLRKHEENGLSQVFQFRKLQIVTRPRVRVFADNLQAGRTPATVTAELSSIRVILAG